MSSEIHLQLGHPILIVIYSLALLSIGAAIGVRWGHYPHVAIWMVVLGAGLMVAHDMLSFSIIFLVSTAWALRASRVRELQKTNELDLAANAGSPRTSRSSGRAKTKRKV
jgi:hypothetical protein